MDEVHGEACRLEERGTRRHQEYDVCVCVCVCECGSGGREGVCGWKKLLGGRAGGRRGMDGVFVCGGKRCSVGFLKVVPAQPHLPPPSCWVDFFTDCIKYTRGVDGGKG